MERIETEDALRAIFPEPEELVVRKALPALDEHARRFIALSPFLLIATRGPEGADVSPRGDPPGFVAVLDARTLLIPERPGNNRLDTLRNLLADPAAGLVFLVPGLGETLRVNGQAEVVAGPGLDALAQKGRVPKAAIRFRIDHMFFHCSKAIVRSRLWDPDAQVERKAFPPLGRILAEQVGGHDPDALTERIARGDRETLY